MNFKKSLLLFAVMAALRLPEFSTFGAGPRQFLRDHVPPVVADLTAIGLMPGTNELHLAIGLPLRNSKELEDLLAQLYDPASTNYHKYLTPEQFTERFGPTEADYSAVEDFARANGLTITATHGNRLLLDVSGRVSDIDRTFHLTLRKYRHPKETRTFYAPDVEPSVDLGVTLADISGLNDYSRPQPKSIRFNAANFLSDLLPKAGSGPGNTYLGNDFRTAYVPGTPLNGAGQIVGLVAFDGFYATDIAAYKNLAGVPDVPVQAILLDGYNGAPTTGSDSGNIEVSLDIEMAIAMAPGLDKVIVFEAGPNGTPNDILNAMAAHPEIKQFGCSWGWSGGPSTTTDNIFKTMVAQGQSFFNASGDSDAFTASFHTVNGVDNLSLPNTPSSCPYITQVGGTTLTVAGAGSAWVSEEVWNWGGGVGSSGGVSSYYSIPSWQTGVSMASNGGSTSKRNIPDVALTADNVYVTYGNGSGGLVGGTSCAAPLWAGYMALINQQAAANGLASIGFANPAIYAIGKGTNYANCFHDVKTGNNIWASSSTKYYAVSGYDLCTGWGTPTGTNLINALAPYLGPVILTGPVSRTITYGATASFQVTASGQSPLRYQWSLDGASIAGATNLQVLLANIEPPSHVIAVTVTNLHGSATSSATLDVQEAIAPVITHVAIMPPSGLTLDLAGTAGNTYLLEATTNLSILTGWQPLATNTLGTNGVWQFNDPDAASFSQRFYRLQLVP